MDINARCTQTRHRDTQNDVDLVTEKVEDVGLDAELDYVPSNVRARVYALKQLNVCTVKRLSRVK